MRVTANSKWWNFPQPKALLVGIPDTRAGNLCRRGNGYPAALGDQTNSHSMILAGHFQRGVFHDNFFFRNENWRQVACSDLALHLCASGRSSGWKSDGWLCIPACLCILEIDECTVLLSLRGDSASHSTGPPAGSSSNCWEVFCIS